MNVQIRVISGCSIYNLGNLPFNLRSGTCGTFNHNSTPTMFFCFDIEEQNTCRTLTFKLDVIPNDGKDFDFDKDFEINSLPDSTYQHSLTTIANYKGKKNFRILMIKVVLDLFETVQS